MARTQRVYNTSEFQNSTVLPGTALTFINKTGDRYSLKCKLPQGRFLDISGTYVFSATAETVQLQATEEASVVISTQQASQGQVDLSFKFGIPRGADGQQGPTGPQGDKGQQGQQGPKGDTGVGISSVQKTSTQGLVDTYTITLTDGSQYTFQVTNAQVTGTTYIIETPEELTSQTSVTYRYTFSALAAPIGLVTNTNHYYPIQKGSVSYNPSNNTFAIDLSPYLAYQNTGIFTPPWTLYCSASF